MSNFSGVLDKANQLVNFQANKYSDVRNQIFSLSDEIAEHTLKLIVFPNNVSVNHWRKELLIWLVKLRNYNNTRTRDKVIGYGPTFSALYEGPFGNLDDLILMLKRIYEINNEDFTLDNFNEENYRISLEAIYDDYCKFINKIMSFDELKDRIDKYYLYEE